MEQEATAQSIAAAKESINDSDDDTPPHNEFDDILDEICAGTGYESDVSEDEMVSIAQGLEAIPGHYSRKVQVASRKMDRKLMRLVPFRFMIPGAFNSLKQSNVIFSFCPHRASDLVLPSL